MQSHTPTPRTTRDEIITALRTATEGETLKIETETGHCEECPVAYATEKTLEFGDSVDTSGRVIFVDEATIYDRPSADQKWFTEGEEIVKVWK